MKDFASVVNMLSTSIPQCPQLNTNCERDNAEKGTSSMVFLILQCKQILLFTIVPYPQKKWLQIQPLCLNNSFLFIIVCALVTSLIFSFFSFDIFHVNFCFASRLPHCFITMIHFFVKFYFFNHMRFF